MAICTQRGAVDGRTSARVSTYIVLVCLGRGKEVQLEHVLFDGLVLVRNLVVHLGQQRQLGVVGQAGKRWGKETVKGLEKDAERVCDK